MRLEKDDVVYSKDEERAIDFSKFQQVVEFYEKYGFYSGREPIPQESLKRDYPEIYKKWDRNVSFEYWIFNYCFKDGLK